MKKENMCVNTFNFNYNVNLNTVNCISAIDFTYHINHYDYPVLHTHEDYFEFTILSNGTLENVRNGHSEIITKDMLFISTPNCAHYFVKKGKDDITIKNIICRSSEVKRLIDCLFNDYYDKLLNGKKLYYLPKHLICHIDTNIDLANSYCETDWKKTNEILKSTIISILSYIYVEDLHNDCSLEKWETILNSLKQDPLFFTYNVNQLCDRLGYSRVQLNRIFINKYNMSPHYYLLKCKMEYAASLLAYTDYSVIDICKMIGYTSQSQFNDNFKNIYGKTPLIYKRECTNTK